MKTIPTLILITLLLTPIASITTTATPQTTTQSFTHTVFAEFGSETTCNCCPPVGQALDTIYKSSDYPFAYVSLVYDVNDAAATRQTEYNQAGFPTVWTDGGNQIQYGYEDGIENILRTDIEQTGTRTVTPLNLTLTTTWLGNATLTITTTIHNNNITTYTGHIHIYICEVKSTMWNDADHNPYNYALLDYALNQNITITTNTTWTDTRTWNGHNYTDGYGHNFSTIQYGNIEIIAVIFNSQPHIGYSQPPDQNPFTAYWTDATASTWIGTQHPPATPSNPNPANESTNIDVTKDLKWTCSDPDIGDGLFYDIYFGTTNPPPLLHTKLSKTTYDPGVMEYTTPYYWKIVAYDNHGNIAEGPVWQFTTSNIPDNTPPTVTVEKPQRGYLYIKDNDGRHRLLSKTAIIIGLITLKVNATDTVSGIDRVTILLDGSILANLTDAPYTYKWIDHLYLPLPHKLSVIAYDESGNTARQNITIIKFL